MPSAVALLLAVACAGAPTLLRRYDPIPQAYDWYLVGLGLLLAAAGCWRVRLDGTALEGPSGSASRRRRMAGALLSLAGAALWLWAPRLLLQSWKDHFDQAWLAWAAGTCLLAAGLDRACAEWRLPVRRVRAVVLTVAMLAAAAALYRFGTFIFFPAESHVTQVEELQVGAMGTAYLMGWRQRWEYLSHAWLAALGIWLGGPTLFAMRAPFVAVSILKTVPLFLWLRFAAGNAAAVIGTMLLVFSAWDVTYARSPTNQNAFIVAAAFALLAGPARRGRPSAYVWLGLLGGYVLFEYVGYRLVGLFAVAGGILASLRRRADSWWARLLRPALTVALIGVMGTTLYLHLSRTSLTYQYYDGWGRARANLTYYRPDDTPGERAQRIGERALRAASLFYFHGDESPVRNLSSEPLTDPVTAVLLVLGVGYGLAHPLRNTGGLTVAALALTLGGTLVATGNFDPIRAGGSVPFVYGLAGFGGAALLEALASAWGRAGRRAAIVLLALLLLAAWADDTRFLRLFVQSPQIRQNQFRDIAYLSGWIGRNLRPGEAALAIAPGYSYVFEGHDAVWMRGVETQGTATWDIASALERWRESRQPTLFFVYAGVSTPAVKEYLSWLLPGLPLVIEQGPKGPESDIAFAHLPAPPEDLARRLDLAAACPGATAELLIAGYDDGTILRHEAAGPLIDRSVFPHAFLSDVWRQQAQTKLIRARFSADFRVDGGGEYGFYVEVAPGTAELFIDGKPLPQSTGGRVLVDLAAGRHTLELRAVYEARAALPSARLWWQGPDTRGEKEIMPFYRLGESPVCRHG